MYVINCPDRIHDIHVYLHWLVDFYGFLLPGTPNNQFISWMFGEASIFLNFLCKDLGTIIQLKQQLYKEWMFRAPGIVKHGSIVPMDPSFGFTKLHQIPKVGTCSRRPPFMRRWPLVGCFVWRLLHP